MLMAFEDMNLKHHKYYSHLIDTKKFIEELNQKNVSNN